jgi:hypothetical protein
LNEKQNKRGGKNILKTSKKQKHNLACIPDFKLLVVFSVPRSAFLAYFQPAGASRSLQGSKSEKAEKTHITNYMCPWAWSEYIRI